MKKLLYLLLLLLPVLGVTQSRYGVEGVPVCWRTPLGVDSSLNRYVLISTTGKPVQTIVYENANGVVVNVSGGTMRYGYCDCIDFTVPDSSVTWEMLTEPVKDSIRFAKRDTFITVPPNTNYFQNIIDNPARFYNNVYLSCKGRTDTSIVAFLANPVFEEQKGVVYNIKNDSGLVAAFVLNYSHFSNSKSFYLLNRGQTAQVRLLPDAANPGQYGWAVNVLWDTNAEGNELCETTLTKTSHGFSKWTPIYWNGSTYVRPINDTIIPDYIVVDSLTANTFKVSSCGTYTTTLANGMYWYTSASPGYSLTQDTIKVPLFSVVQGKLTLRPLVGFNLVATETANSLLEIREVIPAVGLAANESVSNYGFASVNGTTYKFSTAPLGSPSTEYGGWLANGTSGDSIQLSAPFWVVIGDSQAEGHPATHGRLHSPVNLAKADVTGQLSYHLRELTNFRWFNHGIGGQTSTQVLNRFDRDVLAKTYDAGDGLPTKTLSRKPMGVVIVAGINDFYSGITVAQCKLNLTQMAVKCQLEGIYCVMLNVPGDEVINETQAKQVDEVNDWLASGALDSYNVIVVDYNTWWRDPAYNDNAHASNLIVDDIHPSAVGYDSLANYIFREAKLPVLTKVIVYNQLSPTAPVTGFSRPDSIRVGGATTYTLANSIDSFTVTQPITTDSVWFKILASTNVSGTSYSGFSHIEWVLDNGERGRRLEKLGRNVNDLLYPYITIDANDPNQPILYNRPVQRNFPGYFGAPFYTAENVAAGLSPVSHVGKGGFVIQMPESLDGFFGTMELEFSGANSIPLSGIKLAFQNHFYSVEFTGYFAQNRPYFKLVGDQAHPSFRDFYIVVGDSTLTWSYTICRVKHLTSFGGFILPDFYKNTNVTFSTTPRTFAQSKPNTLPQGAGMEWGTPAVYRNAVATSTTDGSGDITITFSSAMPDATYTALCQSEGTTASYTWQIHTKTTASFKVRVRDSNTKAAVTSTSVTFAYEAKDY